MSKRAFHTSIAAVTLLLLLSDSARAADEGAAPKSQATPAGMMGQGLGMTGAETMSGGKQASGMKSGGMMSGGMMSGMMASDMMGSMMEGMMPGRTRGCMMMAEDMMKGQLDLAWMHKALGMSDEQTGKLRAALRPLQKEAILSLASLKIAELELADLLSEEKVDFGKVEAKLKEIEGVRTKVRLAHLKAADAVKGLLTKEQFEKRQEGAESQPSPAPSQPQPQKNDAPQGGSEHEAHH